MLHFALYINVPISGRILTGIGLGLTLSIPMVYIVEIASLEYRGILGVIPLLLVKVGILMTYVLGTTLDWKWLALTRKVASLLTIH